MALSFTQIKETCIYISDLNKTRQFYEGKLGLKCFAEVPGRHIFFKAGSSVLLCFNAEATRIDQNLPPHWGNGRLHFAFECTKLQYNSWLGKIQQEGIEVLQEVSWPNGGRSFYFHDPDMHVVEIVEEGMWDYAG